MGSITYNITYSLFTIDLPARPIHQTTENTSLRHLQISINYPFTILLPIPTIKNLSFFIIAESSLHQVSLSISHLQLTFYYFQTLFALFFICTSLSSFLLSMPSLFLLLLFLIFFLPEIPSRSCLHNSWHIFIMCIIIVSSKYIYLYYSHTIHSWIHSFIHFLIK